MVLEQFMSNLNVLMASNKYIAATVTLLIFFVLAKLVVKILEKIFLRLAAKTKTQVDDDIVKAIRHPISLILLLIGFKLFFLQLWGHLTFEQYLRYSLDSVISIVVIVIILRVINILITGWAEEWAGKTKSHLDDQLVRLAHQILIVAAYIIGFLWILNLWGVEVGPLLAGLGLGGLAIAFALQPTLANIFGGISLILDKTIKVGDHIELSSGEAGKVHDVGIRSTRIKTWNNQILIIPNSKLVDSMVTNFDQPSRDIRLEIPFGVEYGTNIEKVKKLALGCLKGEKHVQKEPEPFVWFTEMADNSLNFVLKFYVDDLSNRWPTHQSVITKIYDRLNKAKIGIPFPQREVWMHQLQK